MWMLDTSGEVQISYKKHLQYKMKEQFEWDK